MTNLTQDQKAALERAQKRTEYTPAPWRIEDNDDVDTSLYGNRITGRISSAIYAGENAVVFPNEDWKGKNSWIEIPEHGDASLIIDAPNLQDLATTQAKIIAELNARINDLTENTWPYWYIVSDYKGQAVWEVHYDANRVEVGSSPDQLQAVFDALDCIKRLRTP